MTFPKSTLAVLAAVSALVATGCSSYDTDHHGASAQIEPSHNLLGIVTTSPGSYINNDKAIFTLSSDEVMARRDVSGDNITFLWGAISLSDY